MEKISLLLLFVCVCIPALPIDSNYEECDNTFASYQASFDYTEQGANWTDPLCKSGKKQSPIKITSGRVQNSDDISMSLECKDISSGTISLDGSDLSIKFNGCNAAFKADNATTKWTSQEIRFHSPSEHIIDDTNEELEIQILFTNDASHDKNLFFSMMFELLEGSSTIKIKLKLILMKWIGSNRIK